MYLWTGLAGTVSRCADGEQEGEDSSPAGSRLLLRVMHVNNKECTTITHAELHHAVSLK